MISAHPVWQFPTVPRVWGSPLSPPQGHLSSLLSLLYISEFCFNDLVSPCYLSLIASLSRCVAIGMCQTALTCVSTRSTNPKREHGTTCSTPRGARPWPPLNTSWNQPMRTASTYPAGLASTCCPVGISFCWPGWSPQSWRPPQLSPPMIDKHTCSCSGASF